MELPSAVVGSASLSRLENFAKFVPRGVHALGVECRLRSDAEAVDLGVALTRDTGGLDRAQLSSAHPALRRALTSKPHWGAIARFGDVWRRDDSALMSWIPFIFLEYDSDATDPAVPSIFAALDSPLGDASTRGCPELIAAREFAQVLLGPAFDVQGSSGLERCFAAMRGNGRVLHVAVMLGRSTKSLRLSVWLANSQFNEYFTAIGALGAEKQLKPLLDLLPESPPYCQIDFEIGPPIAPKLGLGYRPHASQWNRVFDRLVDAGVCDPAKAAALLRWPAGRNSSGVRLRYELSHVKLACTSDGRVEAKCYLGATRDGAHRFAEAKPNGVVQRD